jgi:hypothetical protein
VTLKYDTKRINTGATTDMHVVKNIKLSVSWETTHSQNLRRQDL